MDDYKHPIEFLRIESRPDAIGNQVRTLTPYFRCRARVNWAAGREDMNAGATRQTDEVLFTVRWCRKVATVRSATYLIRFRGELYDILLADNFKYTDREVKFRAVRVQ